jgi:hypothetical protein
MSTVSVNLMGGLGNQLFQLFTAMAVAFDNNTMFFFIDKNDIGCTVRYTFFDTFLSSLQPFIRAQLFPNMRVVTERSYRYSPINISSSNSSSSSLEDNHILLYGYFQSAKYFDKYKEKLFQMIQLEEKKNDVKKAFMNCKICVKNDLKIEIDTDIEQLYSDSIKETDIVEECVCDCFSAFDKEMSKTISIHFRLGDYKKAQYGYPILNINYYINSLKHILSNIKSESVTINRVLYFCEEEDIEYVSISIGILQKQFKDIHFVRCSDELADWQQMLLMSMCAHNIIANSTFSWWGAYMNQREGRMVCYPNVWFGPNKENDVRDLLDVSGFVEIENKLKKGKKEK